MITRCQFATFEDLFAFYNRELFNSELPDVLINMSRKKGAHGFFAPERWKDNKTEALVHEISMNPQSLMRNEIEWHSTLVHEMVHLWAEATGVGGRTAYHNKAWAAKMEEIGLMPSDTGEPGGKKTGQRMTHYVIDNGQFELAFLAVEGRSEQIKLPYMPREIAAGVTKKGKPSKSGVKVKYTCGGCGNNVWGKEGLKILCEECEELFEQEND